jgi:hypothetical protein
MKLWRRQLSFTRSLPRRTDAPRGMNFLYSLNRLNVVTSRAKCLSILVCFPALFEPECKTPEQMRMANAFCRYWRRGCDRHLITSWRFPIYRCLSNLSFPQHYPGRYLQW